MNKKLNRSKLEKAGGGFGLSDIKSGFSKVYSKVKSVFGSASDKLGPTALKAVEKSAERAFQLGVATAVGSIVNGDSKEDVLKKAGIAFGLGGALGAAEGTIKSLKK